MKLSNKSLNIIKNFSTINSNFTISKGNTIRTISVGSNIFVKAEIEESFPTDFGIYDLNEFIGVLSLFESPELEFNDTFVRISENGNSVKYLSANPDHLTKIPQINSLPDPDIEFELSNNLLNSIRKSASALKVTDFMVIGEDGKLVITVGDKKNPSSNSFSTEIGECDGKFSINFKVENLKIINDDYKVSIHAKKIGMFTAKNTPIEYYIALEMDSTFN